MTHPALGLHHHHLVKTTHLQAMSMTMNMVRMKEVQAYPTHASFVQNPSVAWASLSATSRVTEIELPFSCTYCTRLFKHKRSRDRHIKLHTGDKKYHCGDCDSAFSRSDHLKIHMKTHAANKPHKCPVCHRGFLSTNSLHGHMQVHERGKDGANARSPQEWRLKETRKCSRCEEGFDMPEELQKHIAESHPECSSPVGGSLEPGLQCIYCHEPFGDEGTLLSHIDQVHGRDGKSNACTVCSEQFPTIEELYTHMDIHQLPESSNSPSVLPVGYTSVSSTTPDSNLSVDSSTMVEATSAVPKTRGRRKRATHNNMYGRSAKQPKIEYSCIYCNKQVFSSLAVLQIHLKAKHVDKPEQAHTCQFCLEILPSLCKFERAPETDPQRQGSFGVLANLSDDLLQCNFCPEVLEILMRCKSTYGAPMAFLIQSPKKQCIFLPQVLYGIFNWGHSRRTCQTTHCDSGSVQFDSPLAVTPKDPIVEIYSCSYCTNSPILTVS